MTDDPVQIGSICLNSGDCRDIGGSNRNLLDFNDLHIDRDGRVFVAFADGCTDSCASDSNSTAEDSRSRLGSMYYLGSGPSLYESVGMMEMPAHLIKERGPSLSIYHEPTSPGTVMDDLIESTTEEGNRISPTLQDGIKNYLMIDIDGTVGEDIPNEEPERMVTAEAFPDAIRTINAWLMLDTGYVSSLPGQNTTGR